MTAPESKSKSTVITILQEVFRERFLRNPAYSLRAYARDLEVSATFLSLLLNGKRRLSVKRAPKFSAALNLSARKSRQLMKAVALESIACDSTHVDEINRLLTDAGQSTEFQVLELDKFQYFNNWYHVAILDLTACEDFEPNVDWIADRLALSTDVVRSSLARLLRLGAMEEKNGTYVKTDSYIQVPAKKPSNVIRNFHRQMIAKAMEELSSGDEEDFVRRSINGITFAVAPENVEAARKKIAAFKTEMMELVEQGRCTEVYQLNIQFFPLTKKRLKR